MADDIRFVAGGTVQAGQGVYIPRQADQELLALCLGGAFAYVLTPRQMGKSSLMVQTAAALQQQGLRTATVDLSSIGTTLDVEAWYLGMLTTMCRQLGLVRHLMMWWRAHKDLGVTQRFTQFFEEVVLEEISERIVIFIDEIDTTLNLDFTDDFFIAIRSFYLSRASNPKFVRLSFVLFGVATPSDLIRNPQRTPFNIGKRVDLTDFTLSEAAPLASGFGLPEAESQQVLHWVLAWTGGHPYLTQRLCQTLSENNRTHWTEAAVADVVEQIFFGAASKQDTNLQFVRDMLTLRSPDLTAGLTTYRDVLKAKQPVLDEEQSLTKAHLKLSGIVKQEDGVLQVRNPIYQAIFDLNWVREHLPINWVKRLRRAAIAAGTVFLVANVPLLVFATVAWQQAEQGRIKLQKSLQETQFAEQEAVKKGQELEKSLGETQKAREEADKERAEAIDARKEAEEAEEEEAEQRQQAETAQKAEAEQRLLAEQQTEIAFAQRARAEEQTIIARKQTIIAEEQRKIAEEAQLVADLREKATRVLNYLPTPRAAEGLVLAMHATIKSRDLPPDIASEVQSVVESSLLRSSSEVKEQMVIPLYGESPTMASSSDGENIVISEGRSILLLDLQGNFVSDFETEHSAPIVGIGFSADNRIITSIDRDGVKKSWRKDGSLINSSESLASSSIVNSIFSEDGQTVAATLIDGSVATRRLSDNRWTEWFINESLVSNISASLTVDDEAIETETRFQDTYEFEGQAGQQISIHMESEDFDAYLRLETPSGGILAEDFDSGEGTNSSILAILPEPGTYRVVATHSDGGNGTYLIRSEMSEPLGSPLLSELATLESENQFNTYQFEGKKGQAISISMESEDFDSLIHLQNSRGEVISENYDIGVNNYDALISLTLPESDTYTVIATSQEPESSGNYKLQANLTQVVDGPINPVSTNLKESPVFRYSKVHTFEGQAGQEVVIIMESEDFDTYLILENFEGERLAINDDGGMNNNSVLQAILPEDGLYKIKATSFSAEEKGAYRLLINPFPVQSIGISPNGQKLVTGLSNGIVEQWSIQEGIRANTPFRGHQGAVLSVAFSADGQQIITGGRDRTVRRWDLEGNSLGEPFREHGAEVMSIELSADGTRVVSGGKDGTIRQSNLSGNAIGEPFRGHGREVLSVAFSSTNQNIISFGADNTVRIWESNVSAPFQGHKSQVHFVAFSPDGQRIVSSSDDRTLRLWDLEGNQIGPPFQGHEDTIIDVAFSPDGQRIVSGSVDRTLRLWDLEGNQIGHPFQGHRGNVFGVAFSPDGQYIVSGGDDGIRLWDLEGNQVGSLFQGHEDGTSLVAFSPDGQLIVSGGFDGTVRLWDLQGNQIGFPFQGHEGFVYGVAFSPDGQLIVSGGNDRTLRLWDLEGNQVGPPFQGHEGGVISVAFSPDGQRIVSSSFDDTVRLWDLEGNQIGPPFQGHEDSVVGVAFSPDGQRIVSGSFDGTVRLWWASWKEWMEHSCKRLSYHPILQTPDDTYDEAFRKAAKEVRNACQKEIWEED